MTMIRNLVRFSRRQLHTIVSREIIKPSSPTPSHLRTHNLSLLDQIMVNTSMPMVTFYPNTNHSSHDKTLDLKNSLSQTLTKYYPFAGRFAKAAPTYVDCNDDGADFLEASIDTTLSDFLTKSKHEDLDQFFPHGLVNHKSNRQFDDQLDNVIPLAVQVNHFECGGVAVAVSLSHKIADAASLAHFVNDWAKMTRFCSSEKRREFSDDPQFIQFQHVNSNSTEFVYERPDDCVTRSFIFPKLKIDELKLKVKTMTAESAEPITNPSRVDVLTWLLYKSAVTAFTENNPGSCKPTGVAQLVNVRSKMMEKLPEKSIGNFVTHMEIQTKNRSEIRPESVIGELKKQITQFKAVRNIEAVFGIISNVDFEEVKRRDVNLYVCSSMCGYDAYGIDFGWGKPMKTTIAGDLGKNSFVLMDAPGMDGIEVIACLRKHDMAIFESDPELLAYA
ncbi:hypothetical protein LXL04_022992 [Taraxacum kok-saghyz]